MRPCLELAISPCPNDTFTFHALVHDRVDAPFTVQTRYADIDVLNAAAAGATPDPVPDLVKVSYGALPWLLDRYELLSSGSALGRGCGPLVLTRPGRGDLRGARVVVPGERTTAYLLFRLWAAGQELAEVRVLPFDQIMSGVRDGDADAGLVIHESRFTYPRFGLSCLADLGDWWEQETGLAIPLGAILARRDLRERHGVAAADVAAALRASVQAAWADPAASREYVRAHAAELDDEVTAAHIELYVNSFTADLGAEGRAAVDGLLERSAAAGLVPAVAAG